MRLAILLLVTVIAYSCGEASSQEAKANKQEKPWTEDQSLEFIRKTRDQLMSMPTSSEEDLKAMYELRDVLIDSMDVFVRRYPDHEKNQNIYANLYLMHSAKNDFERGMVIGDNILEKYPDFPDRKMVLQGQIDFYVNYITPLNRKKVASYYKILVEENLESDPEIAAENKKLLEEYSAN